MKQKVIVQFLNEINGMQMDLEIPVDITANELIMALDYSFHLGIDFNNETECHMVSENPTVLLIGEQTIEEAGINDGSVIIYKGK